MNFVPRGSPIQSRCVGLSSPILGARKASPPRPVGAQYPRRTSNSPSRSIVEGRRPSMLEEKLERQASSLNLARSASRKSMTPAVSTISSVSSTAKPAQNGIGVPPAQASSCVPRKSLQGSISQPQLPKTLDAQVHLQELPSEGPGRPLKEVQAIDADNSQLEVLSQKAAALCNQGNYQAECPGRPSHLHAADDLVVPLHTPSTRRASPADGAADGCKVFTQSASQSSISASTSASTVASKRDTRKRQDLAYEAWPSDFRYQYAPKQQVDGSAGLDTKGSINSDAGSACGESSRRDTSRGGSACTTASTDNATSKVKPACRTARAMTAMSPRGNFRSYSPRSPIGSATVSDSSRLATPSTKQRSMEAARDVHRRSVDHLRTMADLVKDLREENVDLRDSNSTLQQRLEDLQIKHDAAQSYLDSAIIQQQTPRTRRNLETQARKLEPSLGKRMAANFVQARHLKLHKERVMLNLSGSSASVGVETASPELEALSPVVNIGEQ